MVEEKCGSGAYRRGSEDQQGNLSQYGRLMGFGSGYPGRGNSLFVDTLTAEAFRTLKKAAGLPQISDFYLAGGSAAALYLGHRVSVDLDFFTEIGLYQPEPLIQSLQRVGNLSLQQQSRGTLFGLLDGVQISFFSYPYPLLEKPESLEGIRIAGLTDIALMKYTDLTYPSYHLLRSLVYFTDAEDDVPPRSIAEWDWSEVRDFFRREVKDLMEALS
jgi:hypothetical protein